MSFWTLLDQSDWLMSYLCHSCKIISIIMHWSSNDDHRIFDNGYWVQYSNTYYFNSLVSFQYFNDSLESYQYFNFIIYDIPRNHVNFIFWFPSKSRIILIKPLNASWNLIKVDQAKPMSLYLMVVWLKFQFLMSQQCVNFDIFISSF